MQPNSNAKRGVADKEILAYSYVHKERKASRKRKVISNVQTPNNQSASNSSDPPQGTTERPSLIVSPGTSSERRKSGVTRRARFSLHPSTPKAPTALIKQRPELLSAGSSKEAPSFYSSSIQLSVTPVVESVSNATDGQPTPKAHSRVTFQATGETKYVPLSAASCRGYVATGGKPALRVAATTDSQCLCSQVLINRPSRPLLSPPPPPSTEHARPFTSSGHVQFGDMQDGRHRGNQVFPAIETGWLRTNSKEDDSMQFLPSIGTSHKGDDFIKTITSLQQKDRLNGLTSVESMQRQECPTQGSRIRRTTKQRDQDRQDKVRERVNLGYEKHGIKEEELDDDDEIYRVAEAVARGVPDSFGDETTFDSSLLWSMENELGEKSSDEDTLDVIRVMKEVERSFQVDQQANLLSEEPTREAVCENTHRGASRADESTSSTLELLSSSEDIACLSNFSSDSRKILQLQEEALPVQEVEDLKIPSSWRIYADTHRRERYRRGVENSLSICVSVLVQQLPVAIVLKSFEDPILSTKSVQTSGVPISYSASIEAIQRKLSELGLPRGAHSCRTEMLPGSLRRLCRYHRYLSNLREENCDTRALHRTHSASICRLTHGGRSHECSKRQFSEESLQRSRSVPNLEPIAEPSKLSGQENPDFTVIYNLWREITSSLKELQQLAGPSRAADVGTLTSPAIRSEHPKESEPAIPKDEEPNSVESVETSLQISSPKEFNEICLSPIPKTRTVDTSRQCIAELRELIAKRSRLRQQPEIKPRTAESQCWEDWAGPSGRVGASHGAVGEMTLKRGARSLGRGSAKPKARNKSLNSVKCALDPHHHPHKRAESHRAAFSGQNEEELRNHSGSSLPNGKYTKSYGVHAYRTHGSYDEDCQTNSKAYPSFQLNPSGPLAFTLSPTKAPHAPAVWGDSTGTDSSGDYNNYLGSSVHLSANSPPRHIFFHRLPSPTPVSVRGCTSKGSTRGSLRSSSIVRADGEKDRAEKVVTKAAPFLRSRPAVSRNSGRFPGSFGDGRSKSWDTKNESMRNAEWKDLINEIYAAKNARRLRNEDHTATFQLTPSSKYVRGAAPPRSPSSLSGRSGKVRPAVRDNLLRHTIASLQKVRERKEDLQNSHRKPWVKY
ncbi:unnamed protein product [Dibothriocephalus latus]|uniref:Uncharacterized protein n=1 Tax=Dibothriocephalus latus TaxID=60516 RepID=A0A3P7NWG7_DIBLA|nr:unnamed protein product [Dibothriocephalus latus]